MNLHLDLSKPLEENIISRAEYDKLMKHAMMLEQALREYVEDMHGYASRRVREALGTWMQEYGE
jgi:hypothetical protein